MGGRSKGEREERKKKKKKDKKGKKRKKGGGDRLHWWGVQEGTSSPTGICSMRRVV